MKTVIHKYQMPALNTEHIGFLPQGSTILYAGLDPNDMVCIWALVDLAAPMKTVEFMNIGTGIENQDLEKWTFLGTAIQGPYVNHLFIRGANNG